MKSYEKFLNETWGSDLEIWDQDANSNVTMEWRHLHEFALRYELIEITCEHDHVKSISILDSMGYEKDEIDETIEWFNEEGGHCDCEVYLNVISPHIQMLIRQSNKKTT